MSKNIDDVIKEVMKSNKDIHNMDTHISTDIAEVKKSIKGIEIKIKVLENKIDQAIDILNTFTILIADQDDEDMEEGDDYLNEEKNEWSPYETEEEDYGSNDYDDEDN
jgi:hypothetical protein